MSKTVSVINYTRVLQQPVKHFLPLKAFFHCDEGKTFHFKGAFRK